MASHLKITPFGPWSTVKRLFNNLEGNIKEAAIASQRSITEKYVRKVKAHLRNQDISGWTPLSDKYADHKMGKYGHEMMLIASWTYYESIKTWTVNKITYAGIPSGLQYDNGKEISRIAQIHEAWANIPGKPHRPLWSYTLQNDMGGRFGMAKLVNESFEKHLISKGYLRTL